MAEVTSNASETDTAATASDGSSFFRRQLHGATFLSLEHFLHMGLVVVVAGLLAMGLTAAISMWTGGQAVGQLLFKDSASSLPSSIGSGLSSLEAMSALGIVAGLLVLVPLLMVLDRRTGAEWLKRPGYSKRLAYKLPIYGALAALVAAKVAAVIAMLGVVLQSIALIGVTGEDIGAMYLTEFVPALVAALVFGAAAWYVLKLAKGRDLGKAFSSLVAAIGLVLAVALFITAYLALHNAPRDTYMNPLSPTPGDSRNLEDIFKY
ncbi:MAG TPA: hypothetical protein VLA88_04100 [Candidatus Saccharimonadales bacterium]|nr:hypothetical protein [Candidatus Saccharimonadales bacterium]